MLKQKAKTMIPIQLGRIIVKPQDTLPAPQARRICARQSPPSEGSATTVGRGR